MWVGIWKIGGVCGLLLGAIPAFAQAAPDVTLAAALSGLGARAGVVFAGEVTAIRRMSGVVEVEFRVDQAVKGQTSGSYVLREWSGLWAAGQRRYWVGERAVVFLHQPGKGGLSSSVDGMEGILPITPTSSATLAVDVDRLRTRVQRDVGTPMSEAGVRMSLAEVTSAVVGEAAPVAPPLPRPRPVPRPVRKLPIEILPYQPPSEMQRQEEPEPLLPARQNRPVVEENDASR
jgi:hypothetical protein